MTQTDPTAEQIEQYRRDGFLIVEQWLSDDESSARASASTRVSSTRWRGPGARRGHYTPGVTPPDRTRQLCNVWKADRWLAHVTLAERNGRFGARLAGEPACGSCRTT